MIIYTLIITQCVATGTMIYAKGKKSGELYSLLACQATAVLWMFFSMIEQTSSTTAEMMFSVRLTLIPIMVLGALWLIFSLYYAGIIRTGNQVKIILLILLPPALCMWPLLTDKLFWLIVVSKTLGKSRDVWGILFYSDVCISYVYIFLSAYFIIRKSVGKGGSRAMSLLLVSALLCPVVVNFLTGLKIVGTPGFDLTPLSFAIYSIVISVYIFKYRFIEIIPIAVYELFSTLNEAVFIGDKNGLIKEYNKTCESYFRDYIDLHRCTDIQTFFNLLEAFAEDKLIVSQIASESRNPCYSVESTVKIVFPQEQERQYTLNILPLRDRKDRVIGKLVTFKDVTEYQMSTLETERNRLSDDLHDSLGNCINVINSNLEYALKNFADTPEVKECIRISYEKIPALFST